jgi:hypothetical protein
VCGDGHGVEPLGRSPRDRLEKWMRLNGLCQDDWRPTTFGAATDRKKRHPSPGWQEKQRRPDDLGRDGRPPTTLAKQSNISVIQLQTGRRAESWRHPPPDRQEKRRRLNVLGPDIRPPTTPHEARVLDRHAAQRI